MTNANHSKDLGNLAIGIGLTVAGVGLLVRVPAIKSVCSEALEREDVREYLSNRAKRACELAIDYLTPPRGLQA